MTKVYGRRPTSGASGTSCGWRTANRTVSLRRPPSRDAHMETRPGTDRGASYDPTTSATPPEKASLIEDFIDIFYTPSTVFARRAKSGFGLPLLVIVVIS